MSKQINKTVQFLAMVLVLVLSLAGSVYAVDGVIEINQARAEAGGVTPGDSPGFPVTISESGSYRLTGNLTVSDGSSSAIVIGGYVDYVTLDLNGSTISESGTGHGVYSSGYNHHINVLNGSVISDINLGYLGTSSRVEKVFAVQIWVGTQSIVRSCDAQEITTGPWSIVTGNTVKFSPGDGITADSGSTVLGNSVGGCTGFGLNLGSSAGYANNVLTNNNGGSANPQVDGGIEMGTNVCGNNTTCP